MELMENNIKKELINGVLVVTINRPEKLNSLNKKTIEDLHDVLVESENDNDIRVLIITGEGKKAFVAGADIEELSLLTPNEGRELSSMCHFKIFNFIENYTKPVIASINGFALGGGLELAMACHIRVASSNSKMGLPEVGLGIIPGYGGTQRLPRLVGKGKAFEMIMTTDYINAEEALKYGLVNHVVEQDELLDKSLSIANKICTKSRSSIKSVIKSINSGYNNKQNGYEVEIEEFAKSFLSKDFREGINAFLEKRKPNF
jgi:enoyl-CoA hydratase